LDYSESTSCDGKNEEYLVCTDCQSARRLTTCPTVDPTFGGLLILAAAALAAASLRGEERLKVLAVVAHPDDEYAFAATTYRIARELGGIVDQVVITNGEAGYRYSVLAEQIYGLQLTDEKIGRANLPGR
jgi:hypothetical protein